MDKKLKRNALIGVATFPFILALLVFPAAGTANYWQGWLCIVVFSGATLISTLDLMKNDPALLERRMRSGPTAEKRGEQKVIMWCMTVLFIALFVVAGKDHLHGWSHMPVVIPVIGDCLIVLSYVIIQWVFRTNSFASATIEIADDQKVISTGPYHLVRHPMYSGAMLLLLGIPLALGSFWATIFLAPLLVILIWRIIDEEKLLDKQLTGYSEYRAKVKYRLIPWIY